MKGVLQDLENKAMTSTTFPNTFKNCKCFTMIENTVEEK